MAIDNANAETRYAVINASTREYNLGFILREKSAVAVTRIRNGVSIAINPDDCTIENGKITLSNRVDIMAGDILVLSRVTPDTQEVILTEGSELPAKTIEYGFDRAAMRCAELDTKIENVRKYSLPTATVTQTATGATITVTNASGTTTANIANGKDGDKGDTGPANVLQRDVVCTTADSTEAASAFISGTYPDQQLNLRIPKGVPGAKGDPGDDGFSPTATVTQTATGATITVTDKNGTTTANIANGKDGKGTKGDPGDDGISPTATVTQTATGATITVTDKNGTTTANVTNGKDGSYTLPAATAETLGGVKIGANLSIAPDGTLSANATGGTPSAPSNAVEHLSTLPESWTMQDNGRVFVWDADSIEGSLSKGHIYKVNTVETASGILMQLTPPEGSPGDFASLANNASGLYTPYDTVEGSSGGTVRVYTRYKNPNGYWLAPYISGGNYQSMWMFTNYPSMDPGVATDFTGTISELKTSLTATDLTSVEWGKNFMNSMQSKSFTDVAGGVSADFEDLTPESAVDIPVASASTLGGVKVNNSAGALKVASDGLLALLVSSPEAMKTGSTGIAVNLKTNGGLMFQTVTYGDPTKALGISPKATYNQLSGSSVTITPSVQPYKLTASGAVTLSVASSIGINDTTLSNNDTAYAEIVIVIGESGSITAGMDLTLVDSLTAGKTNYCVVRWESVKAKLFVWRVE